MSLLKYTIEEVREIARSRGGKCLSEEYLGIFTKLKWRCERRHEWLAAPNHVIGGSWCPICALEKTGLKKRLTIEEMREIAKSRGGKCLSNKYTNFFSKLRWQCREGHKWEAIPSNIKRGGWCPECSLHISERICRNYFEKMFGKKFSHVRPKWLVAPNGRKLELDGYCDELKLAFEYQGEQHYKHIGFFAESRSLKGRKEYDKVKKRLCRANGVTLITVPFDVELEKMGEYVIKQCEKRGIKVPNKEISLESLDIYIRGRLEELQTVASSKGGKLLSKRYLNAKRKLKWQCGRGHVWHALPSNIIAGRWCPICARKFARLHSPGARFSIENMQKIAEVVDGKCLSKKYAGNNTKLKWQCEEGHVWNAAPHSVKSGSWCPKCSHKIAGIKRRLTLSEMQRIAISRGGKCLSDKYFGSDVNLKWRCKDGHIWNGLPNNVKKGSWCPKCSQHIKLTISEMRKIAKSRSGECLSGKYVCNKSVLKWRCGMGHVWNATPNCVKRGSWCLRCWRIQMKKNPRRFGRFAKLSKGAKWRGKL